MDNTVHVNHSLSFFLILTAIWSSSPSRPIWPIYPLERPLQPWLWPLLWSGPCGKEVAGRPLCWPLQPWPLASRATCACWTRTTAVCPGRKHWLWSRSCSQSCCGGSGYHRCVPHTLVLTLGFILPATYVMDRVLWLAACVCVCLCFWGFSFVCFLFFSLLFPLLCLCLMLTSSFFTLP